MWKIRTACSSSSSNTSGRKDRGFSAVSGLFGVYADKPTKRNILPMGVQERKKRERERRRRQIRDAALSLLFEKGIQAASINRIAKRAELGVGTLYFYYPSKEHIMADLQARGLALLNREVEKAGRQAKDPARALYRMGRAYLEFSQKNNTYFELIHYFLSSPRTVLPPALKTRVDLAGKSSLDLVAQNIQQGMRQNIFRKVAPQSHALMFWSMIHGMIQMRKMQPTLFDTTTHEDLFFYAVDQFIQGIKNPG